MILLVEQYLKVHSFEQLENDHGICARPNAKINKFSLNYCQFLSKHGDVLAEQCRGLIVSPKIPVNVDNWHSMTVGDVDVMAWPLNRFYNSNQTQSSVDWNDAKLRVYEKLDGTMIIMYWDTKESRWYSATRSVPEADIPICKDHIQIGNTTFSGLFWTTLESVYNDSNVCGDYNFDVWLNEVFDKENTYVFELTSQFNRIVVKYDTPKITLLAIRNTKIGNEISIEGIGIPVDIPKKMSLNDNDPMKLMTFINSCDPVKLEGAVVVDSKFNRLKFKSEAWLMLSSAKDSLTISRRSALRMMIKGKMDDVISIVEKDIALKLLALQESLYEYLKSIDRNFRMFKETAVDDRKLFAEQVKSSGDWMMPYFYLWDGKYKTSYEWIVNEKLHNPSLDLILSKLKLDTSNSNDYFGSGVIFHTYEIRGDTMLIIIDLMGDEDTIQVGSSPEDDIKKIKHDNEIKYKRMIEDLFYKTPQLQIVPIEQPLRRRK